MNPKPYLVAAIVGMLVLPAVAAEPEDPPQIVDPAFVPGVTDWGGVYTPTPEVDILEARWSADETTVTFSWRVLDLSYRTSRYEDAWYTLAFKNEEPGYEYRSLLVDAHSDHASGWWFSFTLGCSGVPCTSDATFVPGTADLETDTITIRVPRAALEGNQFTCGRISTVAHAWDLWALFHVGIGIPTGADIAPKNGVIRVCGPGIELD